MEAPTFWHAAGEEVLQLLWLGHPSTWQRGAGHLHAGLRCRGGLVDGGTVARARAAGLEAEEHVRMHSALKPLDTAGDLLVTGSTGTNVNDLRLMLMRP
ncbi:MOFRL family protein [Chloroflexota bacterium]